jgi:hypothetical protein
MQSCPETRWVLAGYSQGAMVVTEAVKSFRYDKVVYIALFGDPQLNLPEGKGILPPACLGRNYSSYRVYVPNCRTDTGSLGARNPYEYGELAGKYGLWCHEKDFVCGSTHLPWEISGHLTYSQRMSQLVGILRRLLPYNSRSVPTVDDSRVFALLSQDSYRAHVGDVVTVDASPSFGLDVDICDYSWSIDGGEFWSSGAESTITRSFDAAGIHRVTVRVTDYLDETAEYASEIIVGSESDSVELSAPVGVVARAEDASVILDWSASEIVAPYLRIRMNDYDLGYVDSTQKTITVNDVDLSETNTFEVAWMSEEVIGAWAAAKWINSSPPDMFDSPNTGVTFADGMLLCFSAIVCLAIIAKIMW